MKKAKVTKPKGQPFEGKLGLSVLLAGLFCTLFLLKQQIDRNEAANTPTISSISSTPDHPVDRVNDFIANIKEMPPTDKHAEFIAYAEEALADNDLTPVEYSRIKLKHHALQEEAIKELPEEVANLNVNNKLEEATF